MKLWETTFGPPVTLAPPYVDSGQWWQKVHGAPQLPGEDMGFQLMVAPSSSPDQFVKHQIIPWPVGGHSLHQLVVGDDPAQPGQVRSNWFFRPNIQAYDREWRQVSRVYLQPDLLAAMSTHSFPFNFRQLWEFKIGEANKEPVFRMNCGVVWKRSQGLMWEMAVQAAPFSSPDTTVWNASKPGVVVGQWFEYEVYVLIHRTSGTFRVKFNGQKIGEYIGSTTPIPAGNISGRWKLATLYTATDRISRPHWQAVDYIELHDDAG